MKIDSAGWASRSALTAAARLAIASGDATDRPTAKGLFSST
jgi:hypothetical protein